MRGTVLPEEVIKLSTLKKISLVVVAFYFFKIFIIQTGAAYLSPVRTADFLPAQPKLFPVCST